MDVALAAADAVADAAADAVDKKNFYIMRSTNMKRSGTTTTFTLVCVAVLLTSYGIGLGIREIRFKNVKAQNKVNKTGVPANTSQQRQSTSAARSPQSGQPDATFLGENRTTDGAQDGSMNRRGRFDENASDEDRSQMRSGRRSRRGMDFENLSDEERAAWEEQMRQRRERFQNMTDEERAQFRGSRGGRGSRSRTGMSDVGGGENDFGIEADNLQSDENDTQARDENMEYQEDESQLENDDIDQEEIDNDIE